MRRFLLLAFFLCDFTFGSEVVPPPAKTVHVVVALCDNRHQGIVPVPEALGNGQAPESNLYWGAMYGVKTFLKRAPGWRHITDEEISSPSLDLLERLVFFHESTRTYLVADAYDGRRMKAALIAFLYPGVESITLGNQIRLPLGPDASLRVFIGHNGLMETRIHMPKKKKPAKTPAIALACASERFFAPHFERSGLWSLVTTTDLMAPEAYVLEAAVVAWAKGGMPSQVRLAATRAYARYQRIGINAAARLFTGRKDREVQKPPSVEKAERISGRPCPVGYRRISLESGSFAQYVRNLPLKAPGESVRAWDGSVVRSSESVQAVVDWAPPDKVQQCADVAIRLRAEYLLAKGKRDQILFRSLSDDAIAYNRWLEGSYQVNLEGTRIVFKDSFRTRRHTREEFERYLRYVMVYANSASLSRDLRKIDPSDILPGDLFIQPDLHGRGGIGHVSIILDVCEDQRKERLYLIGYGFIPAQDFHLPLPGKGEGRCGWFSRSGFERHVAAFGKGCYHRFD